MGRDIVRHNATELTVPQVSAIVQFVDGSNVTAAAAAVGVDRATVYRWMADNPAFVAALNLAKQEALQAVRNEIRIGASEAVRTVRDLITHPASGVSTRLRAALALIDRVGASLPEAIGPTDPQSIAAERCREAHAKLLDPDW
jgi:hypothetical protein